MLYAVTIIYQGFFDAKLTLIYKYAIIILNLKIPFFMNYVPYLLVVNFFLLVIIVALLPTAIKTYKESKKISQ